MQIKASSITFLLYIAALLVILVPSPLSIVTVLHSHNQNILTLAITLTLPLITYFYFRFISSEQVNFSMLTAKRTLFALIIYELPMIFILVLPVTSSIKYDFLNTHNLFRLTMNLIMVILASSALALNTLGFLTKKAPGFPLSLYLKTFFMYVCTALVMFATALITIMN